MNMLFLKSLKLINYCSYTNYTFDFTKPNGEPYQYICFFGPNGCGKSNALEAISMLTANWSGRSQQMISQSLQKYVTHDDYNPTWQKMLNKKTQQVDMLIEGTYIMGGNEYVVQLTQNGYIRNDFAPMTTDDVDDEEKETLLYSGPWGKDHLQYRQRITHFLKTDSDLSLNKFQLHISQKEKFEKVVSLITRFPVVCLEPSGFTAEEQSYCTDVVIEKKGRKIHFKRMSAGEKKICKSFSDVLNNMRSMENPTKGEISMPGWPRILLIDNVEMHVYYDRHVQLIECLKDVFSRQQIFATTHSGILIPRFLNGENDKDEELMIDLEKIN
jgi:predicted ATP-binding protein involved in virulence